MNKNKIKKTTSFIALFLVVMIFSGLLSYVRADYIEALNPVLDNPPAPITKGPVDSFINNEPGFFKIGKLGITKDQNTKPVDINNFNSNSLVVMGLLASDALTSSYYNIIRAELDINSNLNALFFGDPTNNVFMQKNTNNSPKTFTVGQHTRVPRIVIGSKTAPIDMYNLYLAEGSNSTNLGKSRDFSTYSGGPNGDYKINGKTSFCTMTDTHFKDKGCPDMTYMGQIVPDLNTSSSGDIVAACYDLVGNGTYYPYSTNFNKGSCY